MSRCAGWLALLLPLAGPASTLQAHPIRNRIAYDRVSRKLHGQVVDFTRNDRGDKRIWSPSLQAYRDLYVYLPPGYDPHQPYPLMLLLHGFAEDESIILRQVFARIDEAIWCGRLPPMVVGAPDGSLRGLDCLFSVGSFFVNSPAGRYEDYLVCDIYGFMLRNYSICPEPDAHVLMGISMGGTAAFNKVFKYPQHFRTAVGLFPPLNIRWEDCHGNHRANFDPSCWGWRTDFEHRRSVEGRFFGIPVRLGKVINRIYPRNDPEGTLASISSENPIEMLRTYDIQPGQHNLYVAYGGRDEFNVDAQIESFLWCARERGLDVGVGYLPDGHHNMKTATQLWPGIVTWLNQVLQPYRAPICGSPGCHP